MKNFFAWISGIFSSPKKEAGSVYPYSVNQTVRIRFTLEGNVFETKTRVADITEGTVVLYNPVIAGRMFVLPEGTDVNVTAYATQGVYMFSTTVIMGVDKATMVTLKNRGLSSVACQELRRAMRVWASMEVLCYARRAASADKIEAKEIWARDISESGLCLRSGEAFAEGDVVDVSFYLPNNRGHISAGARVVRVCVDVVPETYLVGVTFTRLSDMAKRQVRGYVADQARGKA
jgi:c-di-GMP-binding flagellar brake protein YcgR